MAKSKVAVLMSGGVDSSYCAYLLQKQGYEVSGIYLRLHEREEKHKKYLKNIALVCEKLGIRSEEIDARAEFKKAVFDEFVASYLRGETPNPCAICNPKMKFGIALEFAQNAGADFIATGHYARIGEFNGVKKIRTAADPSKDQSYFLYALAQSAIDRLIFPLGEKFKKDVKAEALPILPFLGSLETYKDSQEICFVDTTYLDVLRQAKESAQKIDMPGIVRDSKGNAIGTHKGYMHYTIGKRKGFDVPSAMEPHFVIGIDAAKNEIIVGKKDELRRDVVLARCKGTASDFKDGIYKVKIRYKSVPVRADVSLKEGIITARILEKEGVSGVAKGQALVIYHDDLVLTGGEIL